jgi:hypothetical protein
MRRAIAAGMDSPVGTSAAHASFPSVTYEQSPGAAWAPLPRAYRRREPDKTALHTIVREHLETFLDEARQQSEHGDGYPRFVEREFRRYLDCGLLCRG